MNRSAMRTGFKCFKRHQAAPASLAAERLFSRMSALSLLSTLSLCAMLLSCASSNKIGLVSSTVQNRDVFTCQGLSDDNRWVGVTDEFLPEEAVRVVVVAQFAPEDHDAFSIFELTNPLDQVVLTERIKYPSQQFLGVSFPMDRLMNLGGEGEWLATVYANEVPIGDQTFWIGEKIVAEDDDSGAKFFVVGEDSLSESLEEPEPLSDEERYGSYIREVTPGLEIPSAPEGVKYFEIGADDPDDEAP